MYEEKPRKKININWKSLIIKMVILLVVVFIILWIISLANKSKEVEKESNISTNLQFMKEAALEYFTGSKLPEKVNGKKKITLQEMFAEKLLVEFTDQDDKACDGTESYAEATKINSTDYSIKVKLVCEKDSDYVINTIHVENEENTLDDDNVSDSASDSDINNSEVNNSTSNSNNKTTNTSSNNSSTTNTSSNSKNTSTSSNKTNTSSSNNNDATSSNNNISNSNTNSNVAVSNTCNYGKKEYLSSITLAYIVSGDCAVSKEVLYQAEIANPVSKMEADEYKKLYGEVVALADQTNTELYVDEVEQVLVMNIDGTGYVGFQIKFQVRQKLTYQTKIIYSYYLDQNGNRKVIIDTRSSLNKSN